MKLADLLKPQEPIPCPHCIKRGLHGNMLNTDLDRQRGYCLFCAMIPPHKADSGFKLIPDPPEKVWGTPEKPVRPVYDERDQAENEWDGVDHRLWD